MIAFLILSIFLTLAAAAFFAGVETCFLSVSRERILHLAREGGRKAKIVQRAIGNMSRTTTMLLIGNNLSSVAYSTASAALITECCHDSFVRSVWSFTAAFTVLYFSEFLPKLLAAARPLRRSLMVADTYALADLILKPLVDFAVRLTDIFMRGRKDEKYSLTSADLLRILQDRKDGVCLSDFESALISRLIVLKVKHKPITADAILSALKTH